MTMIMPSSGGSPERIVLTSTGDQGDEKELQTLNRQLFLEAYNLINNISSDKPLGLYNMEGGDNSIGKIIRRAVDLLVEGTPIPDRLSQDPTYEEATERKNRENKVLNYIESYSNDIHFSRGFRLMKEFMNGLKPYLDGLGAEPKKEPGNVDGLMSIGLIKLPVIEVINRLANDSRGYSLVEYATEEFIKTCKNGVEADGKKREGINFAMTLFKIAIVAVTLEGEGSPTLERLRKLHP